MPVVLLAVSAAFGQSVVSDSDFQVWNETAFAFPVIKSKDKAGKEFDRLSMLVFGTLRLGQNRLFPVDTRLGAGFDYKINKYLNLTPTYLYRRGAPQRNRKEFERRIRFDLTVGNKWKKFSIKDRSRVEYRARNNSSDSVRYRNKFTFALPVKVKNKEIFSPFVAEEIYYDFSAKQFSSNEFTTGITRQINKNASAEIFYVRRDNRSGQIRHINGVGVNLKFRID